MVLWRRFLPSLLRFNVIRVETARRTLLFSCQLGQNIISARNIQPIDYQLKTLRHKSKKSKVAEDDDDDGIVDDEDDTTLSKDSKIVKLKTTSLRTDLILKSALGIARNKIEKIFYESKIRKNGRKVLKKSASVRVGDEIDMIRNVSPTNPNHIYVARIVIMNITAEEDSITITARRFKRLLIDNYEQDPYKGPTVEEQ